MIDGFSKVKIDPEKPGISRNEQLRTLLENVKKLDLDRYDQSRFEGIINVAIEKGKSAEEKELKEIGERKQKEERRERLNFGSSFHVFSPPPEPALCKLG